MDLDVMSSAKYDYLFKLVLVGDSSVGKSSLMLRFADGDFNEDTRATIGVDFKIKTIFTEGKTVKLQIESFKSIPSWIQTIKRNADPNAHTLLVGNKSDLVSERTVDEGSGMAFAEENGLSFLETSARNSTNVQQTFINMASQILSTIGTSFPVMENMADSFRLESRPVDQTYCCSYI